MTIRPSDSAYDRSTSEQRSDDPGRREYALISDHNGPCSILRECDSLADAIDAARGMDTDAAPTEFEDAIDYDGGRDTDDSGLIEYAQSEGWRIVASAPAGEYWIVMVYDQVACECGKILGERCAWSGPESETVVVEVMPESLRASHSTAGNWGVYPANGAMRLRCHPDCAAVLCSADDGRGTDEYNHIVDA